MPVKAMSQISNEDAVANLEKYFQYQNNGRPLYSGSRFETFAGGGVAVDPNRITPADLTAVSMLAVHVPAQAAIGVTERLTEQIDDLLVRIPIDAKLEEISEAEFEQLLGSGSPSDDLWSLLRQREDVWGVGQTTASKMIARKRPHLVPIYDSVVARQTGLRDSKHQWTQWFDSFQGDAGRALAELLSTIRDEAEQPHLSLLRVLDIVLWMDGRSSQKVKETVGDDD